MPLRAFSQAEMILTERQRLERPLLVLVWLAVCSFSLAEGELFYLLAGTVAVGINLLATWRAKEIYVRRLLVNVGVLLAGAMLVGELLLTREHELVALGHFLILILLCKLFERKTNRDYVQMLGMSLLLMVAATLLTVDVWFGLALAAYVVLACYTGMIFTLKRGLDAAASAQLATESGPLAPQRVAWNVIRDWPGRDLRRRLLVALAIIVNLGVCMFLFMPRLPRAMGNPAFMPQIGQQSVLGLASEVSLGQPPKLYQSDEEVMRLRLSGPLPRSISMVDYGYLRAQTFDRYAHSRWDISPELRQQQPAESALPADTPGLVVQDIQADPALLPMLPGIYPTVRVEYRGFLEQPRHDRDLNWTLPLRPTSPRWVRYRAHSFVGILDDQQKDLLHRLAGRAFIRRLEQENPAQSVVVPDSVRQLAAHWCSDLIRQRLQQPQDADRINLAIARRLSNRLRQDYEYSLDFTDAEPGRDGVEDFLFHMKHGHCEYFASAMTVMCRSLGVTARLATGFRIDDSNARGGEFVVRGRDAHAWTEVYTPSGDWVIMDATGTGPDRTAASSASRWLKEHWLALKGRYHDYVIGYDAYSHRQVSGLFTQALAWAGKNVKAFVGALSRGIANLAARGTLDSTLIRVLIVLGGIGSTVVVALALRRLKRKARPADKAGYSLQLPFMDELMALLAQGRPHLPLATLREQARRTAGTLDLPYEPLSEVVELYYQARWGGCLPTEDQVQAARSKLRQLTAQADTEKLNTALRQRAADKN